MTDAPVSARARNPLAFLDAEIEELKAKGLYRRLRVVQSEQKSRCIIDGREVITLSSNNYLGLNTHPKLRQAALDAVERFGAGSGAVRTIAGTMSLHEELEARLATFKHTEAVLTFQSGFTANTGVIPILAPEGATIVSDALNHASIIDGIRLTKAERRIFPHGDIDALRSALREVRATDARRDDPRHHRRRLQHGRRHREAAGHRGGRRGGRCDRHGRRRARLRRPRSQRARNGRPLRPPRPRARPGWHAVEGNRRPGRVRRRNAEPADRPRASVAPIPLLDLPSAGRRGGLPRRRRRPGDRAGADRPAVGERSLTSRPDSSGSASTPAIRRRRSPRSSSAPGRWRIGSATASSRRVSSRWGSASRRCPRRRAGCERS